MTRDELREAITSVLDERDALDKERHRADHDFVAALREKQRIKSERIELVKRQAIGAGISILIAGFLYMIGDATINFIKGVSDGTIQRRH